MSKVSMSANLPVPVDQLWKLIGGFNAVPKWHPAVESSEVEGSGVGSTRTLKVAGGGTIVERLEAIDDKERVYSYSIVNSPLPVANYTASIRVREGEDGTSVVSWSGEFKPAGASESDAVDAITGIYQAGLDNLRKMFGG